MYLKRNEYDFYYRDGNSYMNSPRFKSMKALEKYKSKVCNSSNCEVISTNITPIYSETPIKNKMAKKSKKPLSAYKVKLSFKSKAGKTFTKGFLSLSSAKRAVAGWKSAGGQMAGKMKTSKSGRTYRSNKLR